MASTRCVCSTPIGRTSFLDIGLPLISGVVVRQELAAHAHTRDIPVVIVTGSASRTTNSTSPACCGSRSPLTRSSPR